MPRQREAQNYVSERRGADPGEQEIRHNYGSEIRPHDDALFDFPTRAEGKFAQAMSSIAKDPNSGSTGSSGQFDSLKNNFHEEVQQALAIKLNFKTRQHANERVLRGLLKSGGRCGTLKQARQARAGV